MDGPLAWGGCFHLPFHLWFSYFLAHMNSHCFGQVFIWHIFLDRTNFKWLSLTWLLWVHTWLLGFLGLVQMMKESAITYTGSTNSPSDSSSPSIFLSQLLCLINNHRLSGILSQQFNRNLQINSLPYISIFLFPTTRKSAHRRVSYYFHVNLNQNRRVFAHTP